MKFFSYVVARDYGFAPNPFHGLCTLATCKPNIRLRANVGDWVFGMRSQVNGCRHHLLYAMKVTEKTTFDEYWASDKYKRKKPIMNGSLKLMYGDNIYHRNSDNSWFQADSHHSNEGGEINQLNLNTDTKTTDAVLVSTEFYYFGEKSIQIPKALVDGVYWDGRNYKHAFPLESEKLLSYLADNYDQGYLGDPVQFSHFKRYNGK